MEKPAKLGVKFFSNYKMKMEINAQAVKKNLLKPNIYLVTKTRII